MMNVLANNENVVKVKVTLIFIIIVWHLKEKFNFSMREKSSNNLRDKL